MSLSRRAKTHKGKRVLKAREPKLLENTKGCLFLKGPTSSAVVNQLLIDLRTLKGTRSKAYQRRNMTRPFEDASSMEFFAQQNDTSLFTYVSHSKKRPHNLVLGRLFNYQMLDMIELAVDAKSYKTMQQCTQERSAIARAGSKPMFLFLGEDFDLKPNFVLFKNFILDFFQGDRITEINLAGIDRVIICTTANEKIYFRHCAVILKKSGTRYPRVELQDVGPNFNCTFRRVKPADEALMKQAMVHPHTKKRKNVETGQLGHKMGRVHMRKQNTDDINVNAMNKLKRRKTAE